MASDTCTFREDEDDDEEEEEDPCCDSVASQLKTLRRRLSSASPPAPAAPMMAVSAAHIQMPLDPDNVAFRAFTTPMRATTHTDFKIVIPSRLFITVRTHNDHFSTI